MISKLLSLVVGMCVLAAGPAEAADAQAGRQKATTCQACHGLDGLSKHPEAPNLAGQIENYLAKALREYRSGERKNEMMTIVTKDLSDQDIDDLAAFYASIEVEVIPPQ
ncbi:c-type cytochrome [Chelatococcus sp. GCM10030263]|uniref:c-type cytochrome n=1 Tax=Chelatococcus sp. GCM10030263 TaxID=3273387 RepID=UPI003618CB8C